MIRHSGESRNPGFQIQEKNWTPAFAGVTAFVVLATIHFYLGSTAIRALSPTYDEPLHLTAGYTYWKTGDYTLNGYGHPPLGEMWAAIPLLSMKPLLPVQHPAWVQHKWGPLDQYGFADFFLYHNRVPSEAMMAAGRRMQLALSIVLGALIATSAFALGGGWAAAFAMVFWAFSPTFLASATLVSTDLSFATFFFGFFAALTRIESKKMSALAGLSLGLCLVSKYFALALGPILAALFLYEIFVQKKKPGNVLGWLIIGAGAAATVTAVYRFGDLDVFIGGIKHGLELAKQGRASFFMGRHGTEGWLLYFPTAFLMKTPLPFLIALLAAGVAVTRRKISITPSLWIPPFVFFAMACTLKVQIGHRHLLAIYPFLCVIAALGLDAAIGRGKWLAAPLLLWSAAGAWMVKPHFLAYFNEWVGGPKNGYHYFTDSNVDWGQGLKLLGEGLTDDERSKGIYLCYFGVADPHAYGIRYLDVGSDSIVPRADDRSLGLHPMTLAISVTNLQGTYYANQQVFVWLKDREPIRKIAHSIFVYDFSKDPDAIAMIERLRT